MDRRREREIGGKYDPVDLFDSRLSRDTIVRYEKYLGRLKDEGYEASYEGLLGRVTDPEPITAGTLKAILSAVQWHLERQQHTGVQCIPKEKADYLRGLFAGRGRKELTDAQLVVHSRRGAIDRDMLDQLCEYMRVVEDKPLELRQAVILCWSTGLRTSQMSTVRSGDFHFDEKKKVFTLTLVKIHDPARWTKRGGVPLYEVRKVETLANGIILRAQGANATGAPMYPSWCPRLVCEMIQKCAAHYGWPGGLKWDGAHCLRHGVASHVCETRGIEAAAKVLGHAGWCINRYVQSNQARLAGIAARWDPAAGDIFE